jgi:retron-type reverse transcriptase
MKRLNNLYEKIYSIDNLVGADVNARRGKSKQYGVKLHLQNEDAKTYKTSQYTIFKIQERKERLVYRLPYTDRIVHHAIMNLLEPIFMSVYTADSYSCIKGKGIKAASDAVKFALKDKHNTQFCLKLDVKKFYPSINHEILKSLLRKKIKDNDLLWLLDGIIDSADGLPIGNYLSQHFANFYLTYFDHWLKEIKGVKHYFRYCDDLVILASNKPELHQLRVDITTYFAENLKLTVKDDYQIFPVEARGIDFVGYRFYHTHTLLRKSIKQNFARMLARRRNLKSIAGYKGWAKHCDSKNLLSTLLK